MKAISKYIFAALALVVAASCAKEIDSPTPAEPADGAVTFRIQASCAGEFDAPGLKSSIDGSYCPVWEAGDAIAVCNGTTWATSAPLTDADIENAGAKATFTVTIPAASDYTLVFPASSADTEAPIVAGQVALSIPAQQTIPAGGCVAADALVQVATATDLDGAVAFQNATSLIRFTAPCDGVKSVKFADKTGAAVVAGAATFDTALGTIAAGEGAKTVEVVSAAGLTGGNVYYAAALPCDLASGVKFVFNTDTDKGTITSSKAFEFEQNGGINFTFPAEKISWIPTLIEDKTDLLAFAANAAAYEKGEWVKLGADIDLELAEWTPVNGFKGNLDGQNHSIYNFTVVSESASGVGFFGKLASSCTIKNLKLAVDPTSGESDGKSSVVVRCGRKDSFFVGGLVGLVKEIGGSFTFENITTAFNDGSNGVAARCTVELVEASLRAGGIIGQVGEDTDVTITGCTNKSYVRGTPDSSKVGDPKETLYIGGVLGLTTANNTKIINCINRGKVQLFSARVNSSSSFAGGIIARFGKNLSGQVISGCDNYGEITITVNTKKPVYLAGILGLDNSGTPVAITNCNNYGEVHVGGQSDNVCLGGISSYLQDATVITGCENLGNIYKTANNNQNMAYGGIVGKAVKAAGAKIQNCTNSGDIYSTTHDNTAAYVKSLGGILGVGDIDIINCTNTGQVYLTASKDGPTVYCGGLVGAFANTTSKDVLSAASSTVTGCTCTSSKIDSSCSLGAAGGLFGYVFDSAISTGAGCSVNAVVTATACKGAIVGAFSGVANASVWGTDAQKIGVKGSVGGTTLDSGNFTSYLCGANGSSATFNAEFTL